MATSYDFSSVPVERRLRPGLQSAGKRSARAIRERLAALWRREDGRRQLSYLGLGAGFAQDDLGVTFQSNLLTITGKTQEAPDDSYLHRGIIGRPFEHRFEVADHVRVEGAELSNGLLFINLVREIPETLKPRKIVIQAAPTSPVRTEGQKAA